MPYDFENYLNTTGFQNTHIATESARSGNAFYRKVGKRAMDIAIVLACIGPLFLFMVMIAALVALDGKSPFYSQKRLGMNGRTFRMWKFRSMIPNADEALEAHLLSNADARREWNINQKLRNDPRITPIGRLIRRTSLDELPQLWNVLIGDMSIVGPRPMMVEQRDLYPGDDYAKMRPGITGLWQISVRNESSFAERAQFDTRYYQNLTFRTDAETIGRTFGVVLKATGC